MRAGFAGLLLFPIGCGGASPPDTVHDLARPLPVSEAQPSGSDSEAQPSESASATQVPAYPVRVPRVSEEVLARSEASLRAATSEAWTEVRFDPYGGLLASASIVEPAPTAFPSSPTYDDALMRERWSRFLAEHADLLALDAPGMTPIPERAGQVGFQQEWAGSVVGYAMVSWHDVSYGSDRGWRAARVDVSGHGWPALPPTPTVLTPDELAARLVGWRGTRVVTFAHVRQPCDPPGGALVNPCGRRAEPPTPPEVRVPYALIRADVIVNPPLACRYVVDGATEMELRLAADVMVRLSPAAGDAAPADFVATVGFAPDERLPSRLDAVTGEPLRGSCGD